MNGGEKQIPQSALDVTTPPSYRGPVATPAPMLHFGQNVGLAANAEAAARLKNFLESPQWHGKPLPKGSA